MTKEPQTLLIRSGWRPTTENRTAASWHRCDSNWRRSTSLVRPTLEAVKAPGPRAILASRLSAWGFLVCRRCLWYCEDTWSLMNLGKRRGHLGRSFPPPCQSLDRFTFSYDESSIVKIPQSLLPSRGKEGRRIKSPCLSSRLAAAGRLLDSGCTQQVAVLRLLPPSAWLYHETGARSVPSRFRSPFLS